jgi:hypothetical protein
VKSAVKGAGGTRAAADLAKVPATISRIRKRKGSVRCIETYFRLMLSMAAVKI